MIEDPNFQADSLPPKNHRLAGKPRTESGKRKAYRITSAESSVKRLHASAAS
jgi:hypothetical protein